MIKKISAVLLLSSLFVTGGISAEVTTSSSEVRNGKKYNNGSSRKYGRKSKQLNATDVQVDEHEIDRTTRREYNGNGHSHYGKTTRCSDRGCRMCKSSTSCAAKPVCEKFVKVFEPACEHKEVIERTRFTCPPGTKAVEPNGDCNRCD